MKRVQLLLFALIAILTVKAQIPGSLDSTFGVNGIYVPPQDYNEIFKVVQQTDGKLVCIGYKYQPGISILARYFPDGTPDSDFGTNGIVEIESSSTFGAVFVDLHLLPDGRFVTSGYNGVYLASGNISLARFLSDGSPDPTFGTNGLVISELTNGFDIGRAVAVQDDGKILVAGYSEDNNDYNFVLIRYLANGNFDPSFGAGGQISLVLSDDDTLEDVVIDDQGNILVCGHTWVGTHYDFIIMRFTSDGLPDNTFNYNGRLIADIDNGSNDLANNMSLQADGKILVTGVSENQEDDADFATIRINTNGIPDNSFGQSGIAVNGFVNDYYDEAKYVGVQPDGKILVAGNTKLDGFNYHVGILRYNEDGSLDNSFGFLGYSGIQHGTVDVIGDALLTADQHLLVVGVTDSSPMMARFITGLETGFPEYSSLPDVLVYPNPSAGTPVEVAISLDQPGMVSVGLFDATGRSYGDIIPRQWFASGRHTLEIPSWKIAGPGLWFIRINKPGGNQLIKLVRR